MSDVDILMQQRETTVDVLMDNRSAVNAPGTEQSAAAPVGSKEDESAVGKVAAGRRTRRRTTTAPTTPPVTRAAKRKREVVAEAQVENKPGESVSSGQTLDHHAEGPETATSPEITRPPSPCPPPKKKAKVEPEAKKLPAPKAKAASARKARAPSRPKRPRAAPANKKGGKASPQEVPKDQAPAIPAIPEKPIRTYAPANEAEAALLLEICGMEWMKPEAPKVSGMFETFTTASGQVFEIIPTAPNARELSYEEFLSLDFGASKKAGAAGNAGGDETEDELEPAPYRSPWVRAFDAAVRSTVGLA